jgi:glycosyltransferase involved in cell wall biosynthesis
LDAIKIAWGVKKIISDVELVWIGGGSLLEKCRRLVKKDTYIHFMGDIKSRSEKWSWLRRSNAFISTSQREGFNIPIGEALLAKLPVVAYYLPVYRAVYEDTVIYVPLFDVNTFTKKVIDVLLNPSYYKPLIEKGFRLVKNRYSSEAVMKLTENALKEVLDGSVE